MFISGALQLKNLMFEASVVVHVYNTSSQEVEAGGSGIEGYLQLHSKFETSLVYMRPCLE